MADAFDPRFVDAYSKITGRKQTIPRHWLDDEVLGADFSLTPTARAREAVDVENGTPDQAWTVPQLRAYAANHDVDLAGATRKPDILAALSVSPTDTTTDQPSTDETPASGDEE